MLNKNDIKGLYAMMVTPTREGAGNWDAKDVVNLDETARAVEEFCKAGIGGFALIGTTGECGCLLWEEKQKFISVVSETAKKRVPIFAGATTLGTRDTIRQMKGLKDVGADGAFNGLPLWQTPTYENSTNYYKDLGEAIPDMPILVYANMRFFKMKFLADWWDLLAKRASTVVAAKISYSMDHLEDDIKAAGSKIRFIPNTGGAVSAYERVGDNIRAVWSTTATCGPEPSVALANAIQNRNNEEMKRIDADFKATIPHIPPDDRPGFDNYNSQSNKWVTNLCGWMKGGPLLAPYNDFPEKWRKQSELSAPTLIALRKKYLGIKAK